MIPWLHGDEPFPPVTKALRSPNGLLCAGGDLGPERLLDAYRHGIFPWYSEGDPILWWSPDPRMVLYPPELKVSRSLRKTVARGTYETRMDTAFRAVIEACSAPRDGHGGTWIVPEMIEAYTRLHELGHAHSVESWQDGELAGGLYGVCLGSCFFGESMFSRLTDASKAAFATLAASAAPLQIELIDCQLPNEHLRSLGATEISRAEFLRRLKLCLRHPREPGKWTGLLPPPVTQGR